ATMVVHEAGHAHGHVGQRRFGKDRDSVVGLLPREYGRVPGRLDLHQRELRVLDLRFLQADDIRPGLRCPVEQMRKPDLQGVDVPGREFRQTDWIYYCVSDEAYG